MTGWSIFKLFYCRYYSTQQLSTKSDVFSFGVVLLEIVTGREPLNVHRPRSEWSLVEWVLFQFWVCHGHVWLWLINLNLNRKNYVWMQAKPFIRESRIEEIVDPSIKGGYHAEAMWRVVEAALTCIEPFSTYRPSMVDIVRELEDALIIENNASEYMRSIESFGGSNRFIFIERKMPAASSSPPEPSPNYCKLPAPLPR